MPGGTNWHLLSLEQQSGVLYASPSRSLIKQMCISAHEQVQRHGGITARVFAHTILPLLVHSTTNNSINTLYYALAELMPFRRCGVAPVEKNKAGESARPTTLNSAAAHCAFDTLCLVFSYLPVGDFLVVQQVCRNWRAVRLHSSSWPSGGSMRVHAQMMLHYDASPTIQSHALHSLRGEMLSKSTPHSLAYLEIKKLVMLLQSSEADLQVASARVLALFHTKNLGYLVDYDGISALTTLLRTSHNAIVKCAAACALGNIAHHRSKFRVAVLNTKVFPLVLELCAREQGKADIALLRSATRLLSALCKIRTLEPSMVQAALVVVARLLHTAVVVDDELLTSACSMIYGLAHDSTIDRQQVSAIIQVDAGKVALRIVELVQHENVSVATMAAKAVLHIASGDDVHKQAMLDCGILPRLLTLLKHSERDLRVRACSVFCNLSAQNQAQNNVVLFTDSIVSEFVHILNTDDMDMKLHIAMVIRNISVDASKEQVRHLAQRGVILPLCNLICSSCLHAVEHALYAMYTQSYVLNDDDTALHSDLFITMVKTGATSRIVQLLQHHEASIQTFALFVVHQMVCGKDRMPTQALVDYDVVPRLLILLTHKDALIRSFACATVRNMAADGEQPIAAIITAGIIPQLVCILHKDDADVQAEAAMAICNTVSESKEHIAYLMQQVTLPHLCAMLSDSDEELIEHALSALNNVLVVGRDTQVQDRSNHQYADMVDQCGGLDTIKALQSHKLPDIQTLARTILTTHFQPVDKDADMSLVKNTLSEWQV
jgi:importin subunit alpha-1